jgi:hypothetical protein
MPLYENMAEPGFKASERTALITTMAISAVGQGESLWLIPRFDDDRSLMIPPRTRQTDHRSP